MTIEDAQLIINDEVPYKIERKLFKQIEDGFSKREELIPTLEHL